MYKILVYLYTKYKQTNQFKIGYMINRSLHVNKVFREKVEKFSRDIYHENTMKNIKNVMRKKNTCVIALIILYESKSKTPVKVYKVLSYVIYYLINNYVLIDYLCCQSKTLSIISYGRIF